MSEKDLTTRNAILKAAFELLSTDDVKDITIRSIAHHANVAISAINYHFQTKENLIDLSINAGVGNIVNNAVELFNNLPDKSYKKLIIVLNDICNKIASLSRISKISIINDLQRGFALDNIYNSVNALNYMLNEIFNGKEYPVKSKNEIRIISYQITSSIQFGFLRSEQLREEIGLNFYLSNDRNKYIEYILNNLIHK